MPIERRPVSVSCGTPSSKSNKLISLHVLRRVRDVLAIHRITTFTRYVTELHATPISPPDNEPRDLHTIKFAASHGSYTQLATVRQRRCTALVDILCNGHWIDLEKWLAAAPDVYDGQNYFRVKEVGWTIQRAWWRVHGLANNLHFPLLKLPPELLSSVYLAVLQPRTNPGLPGGGPIFGNCVDRQSNRYKFGTGWFEDDLADYPDAATQLPVNRALLGVSRDVRDRALEAVWRDARQVFQSYQGFNRLNAVTHLLPYWTLRKVCFDYSMENWANLLGIPIGYGYTRLVFDPANPSPDPTLQQVLPQLQDLEIYFRSPKHTSPPPLPPVTAEGEEDEDAGRVYDGDALLNYMPCQRMVCNAILVYAWPWIKDVGTIRLRGCIKDSTKSLWQERHRLYHYARQEPDLQEDEDWIKQVCRAEL
jgi:hypothetical protein